MYSTHIIGCVEPESQSNEVVASNQIPVWDIWILSRVGLAIVQVSGSEVEEAGGVGPWGVSVPTAGWICVSSRAVTLSRAIPKPRMLTTPPRFGRFWVAAYLAYSECNRFLFCATEPVPGPGRFGFGVCGVARSCCVWDVAKCAV